MANWRLLLRHNAKDILDKNETTASVNSQANELMHAMVRANERSYRAYLLRADYRRHFLAANEPKEAEEADRDIARASELDPDAADVLIAMATMNLNKDYVEEARKLLRHGCELHATDARLFQQLAQLEERAGQTDAAVASLRSGLVKLQNHPDLLWHLADLLTQAGRKDESEEVLSRLDASAFLKWTEPVFVPNS